MLKSCIGYGISINWESDTFPPALFDGLSEQSQKELLEDHLDDYGITYSSLKGRDVVEHFSPCAAYACVLAHVITKYPLLDVSTPGFYNNEDNPAVVVYIKSSHHATSGNAVEQIYPPAATHEELDALNDFQTRYFPEKMPLPIFWAEVS